MAKRINVTGEIVNSSRGQIYRWLGIDHTSPDEVKQALMDAGGEDVEVYINSPGGSVFEGSEIYTELRDYSGHVKIKITGIAASAASVIAQAGESEISPTGMMMIHNVQTRAEGDYRSMEMSAEQLRAADQSIINAYVEKTGMGEEELQQLMDRETFMSAKEAVELGFVDSVMFEAKPIALENSLGASLSDEAVNKIRTILAREKSAQEKEKTALLEAKLELLKLKGEIRNEEN